MKIFFLGFLLLLFNFQNCKSQDTHIIEPCLMEISYQESYNGMGSNFALRIGKNHSQYFCYDKLRSDSLGSNQETGMILLNELLDAAKNRQDKSKQKGTGPGCDEYTYRNIEKNTFTTYAQIVSTSYRIEETIPQQDWTINEDTTMLILGFNCYMATTHFRGRDWTVWYTEEIPVQQGPWKLGGLPGLILSAESKDFVNLKAIAVNTGNLTPITFYNYWNKKFEDVEREAFLKISNNHTLYPKGTIMTPKFELE
ncbi:GLPGLI family protein [Prevotella sp. HUN102]|uniref:GLPGLI family protein n=1 Tax=Prevotella sp. HUN102 TaxID=1392486 RepID=UPI00048DA80A|nr:GLPGLI family protein [Prevotella sp. HUN102]